MEKPNETKRIFVTALILAMAIVCFPLSSFGDAGCVYRWKGDIEFLQFDFGPGLPLALPGLGEVTVLEAEVFASGKETTVVTPFNQYIYHAKLFAGQGGEEKGVIKAYAIVYTEEGSLETELWFEFESAKLFENFVIDESEIPAACAGEEVTVPPDVNLFFRVKGATPIGMPEIEFNLILKILYGYPVVIKVW